MKAPDIRRSTVDTTSLVIVGIDVPLDEFNKDYFDEATTNRVLSDPAVYAAADVEARQEWDNFLQSIVDTGGLLQPPIVDVKEFEGGYSCYVIDGRRRTAAVKQLLQRATAAGDEAAMKKFARTAVTTVPSNVSRADIAIISNQFRKNYTVEEQIRLAGVMRDSGVDKEEIAKRLNCSTNHTDKLYRRYKSIPALRNAIVHKEVDIREGDELTWCFEDHELQTRVFNIYMLWRGANYCMKRSPGFYVMAQRFHKFVLELGIGPTEDQIKRDVNEWLHGPSDSSTVQTIDGGTADGAWVVSEPKPTNDSGGSGGSSGGGSGGGSSLDSLDLEEAPTGDKPADASADKADEPTPAAPPAAAPPSIIVFKLTNKDMRSLLMDNFQGVRYADDLNEQARALLELIVLGKAPEKTNRATLPLLRFLAWEDQFSDAFKRVYGVEAWQKITSDMQKEAQEVQAAQAAAKDAKKKK